MSDSIASESSATQTEDDFVLEKMSGNVLWLTLNRPKQRNPLSSGMINAISRSVALANDNPAVRVIVLEGAGPVFSAGHNLKEMSAAPQGGSLSYEDHLREVLTRCAQMMLGIMHSPKAIIAAVQGTATAAGCQLVSACDLAIAADHAQFCTPGVNIGTFCTTPLVGIGRNMHRKHAMELALTGDMISADDAVRFGLLNRVVPAELLKQEVEALAQKIASKSAQGIRAGKMAYYEQIEMPIRQAFDYAIEEMIKATMSADAKEGTSAFLEKRAPHWSDA